MGYTLMIQAARKPINAWTRSSGAKPNYNKAIASKSKGFPTTTKCKVSALGPHTARITSSPTTVLRTRQRLHPCGWRWKIEQVHREGKQGTGLERCECRKARIQRNHIACAFLVWVRLKALAVETGRTVYQLKHGLLDDYLLQQLKHLRFRWRWSNH